MSQYSRSYIWNVVPSAPTISKRCPRCGNMTEFQLAWDGDRLFFNFWLWRKTVYKCPICPYVTEVPVASVRNYLE